MRTPRRLSISIKIDMKCLRPLLTLIIGLCLGITMSMMYAPFSEDSCETYVSKQDPQELVKRRETKSLEVQQDGEGKFEPRLRLQEKPGGNTGVGNVGGSTKKLIRPRYASTELGILDKLFVAVITSRNTIDTLGVAFNKTVQHHVTKLVFFMDDKGQSLPSGMSVVSFADKRPHLIPIHILKYIAEHYPDKFDYYMFVSDRTYIRGETLFDFVSGVSVSHHMYLGCPKAADGTDVYCSLDGGIIISQSILSQVLSEMEWCTTNCHSSDPTINMGKCLQHATGRSCQGHINFHPYGHTQVHDFDFDDDIVILKEKETFNNSIAVYPMPDDTNYYKLHRYFCILELNLTEQAIAKTTENIIYMSQFAPGGRDSITWPVGVPEPYRPKNRFDVIRWDYFTETHIYFDDDFSNVEELKGVDKQDIQEVIKLSVDKLNAKYNNGFLYSHLANGYRRFDPQRGMEYTMDIALRDISAANKEVEKRVHLVRPLGQVEIVPMPYVTENTRINLILPVTEEDKDGVGNFLDSYAHTCLDSGDNTYLLIVFIYKQGFQEDTFSVLKSMISYYEKKYQSSDKIAWISLQHNSSYYSEFFILDEVSLKFPPDSLLLMCTVGMELAADYFNRIRMNTIQGWQVFFPIGFWQYKPNLIFDRKPYPTVIDINGKTGHYDANSFEHSSFYNADFIAARKLLTSTEVRNEGLFDMFVKYQEIHVFRAIEPDLKHRYKPMECYPSAPEKLYERCLSRRAVGLATRGQLAKLVFEHNDKAQQASANMKGPEDDPNMEPIRLEN
ncbi:chondroitin sulfate synthase 2-like [Haliotis rufescens]|uniref:chondroitin sulfate synthase 2-like n=1 Tax=Haliotis rufescens TaxID=6454 RepID=UPI00201EBA03|nr:chondroitin sulfate synthase 2-like [Haliotis rufescens]